MQNNAVNHTIKHGRNRFYIGESEDQILAEVVFYPINDSVINLEHTFVSPDIREKGLARKMVDTVVQYAREQGMKVLPTCPYAKKVMTSDSQYQDILEE
jgi:predicted GNAT family acetyltransferase